MMHEGHDHGHEHTHQHVHADGTVHTHSHDHSHGEGHEHCHHGEGTVSEQTMALLSYMLDHNRDHAAEVHELAHKLEHEGRAEEAELIHKGVALYNEGNDQLAQALAKLKGEEA